MQNFIVISYIEYTPVQQDMHTKKTEKQEYCSGL